MSDTDTNADESKAGKKSKLKLVVLGLVVLVAGGGAGFVGYSGLLDSVTQKEEVVEGVTDVEFVTLPEIVVSLGPGASARHLRAVLHIEVDPASKERVAMLEPRILDVLNTFLRAVEERDLSTPANFSRLQAQMLRRVQLVVGKQHAKDLLVGDFVLQ